MILYILYIVSLILRDACSSPIEYYFNHPLEMRDYKELTYYSQERAEYYKNVNSSEKKRIGDQGEDRIMNYLTKRGWQVTKSSPTEDADHHTDFFIWFENRWQRVDVKHQKQVALEIKNHWGKPGSTITENGADIVMHLIQNTNTVYFYRREDMINWWNYNFSLHNYTKKKGNAELFFLYPKTMSKMKFIQKINLD